MTLLKDCLTRQRSLVFNINEILEKRRLLCTEK